MLVVSDGPYQLAARYSSWDSGNATGCWLEDLDEDKIITWTKPLWSVIGQAASAEPDLAFILKQLQLYATDMILGAVLLFAKTPQRWARHAILVGAHFNRHGHRIAHTLIGGTLMDQVDGMLNWLQVQTGQQKAAVNEFPELPIRAMLKRAVLRRNYRVPGVTSVLLHPTHLQIQYPVPAPDYVAPVDVSALRDEKLRQWLKGYGNSTVNLRYVLEHAGWLHDVEAFIDSGLVMPAGSQFWQPSFDQPVWTLETVTFRRFRSRWDYRREQVEDDPRCTQVLDYLERNIAITNKTCRALLGVSDETARSVLSRLVQSELVKPEGAGRAVRYLRVGDV